jgi:protein O-GlcNAc transferase
VSPDLRSHSVAFFVEPLLKTHDRARFDVFCYADVRHPDAVTERLKGLTDHWRDIVGLDDVEVARLICEDRVDILVDLAGHTAHNRLLVFARKPAPIQIAYLGYPNTRGFDDMDYWLTDALADPPGESGRFYVEEIVRLPNGFNCYQPPPQSPPVSPLPALETGHINLGSFNNATKINEGVIACWAAILHAVPQARLILKARALADRQTRKRLEQYFIGYGIPVERVEMIGWIPASADHLELYDRVDIALDTFPYNGHTTTCEALWMGVPVITLAGKVHAGRVGVSLLTQAGLSELIAESPQAYVDMAVGLTRDRERLAELRQGLRGRIKRSPLTDATGLTCAIEAAYRTMWQTWCQRTQGDQA